MHRRECLTLAAAAAATTLAGCATPVDDSPLELSLGTATPGGGFPVYGDALAAALAGADSRLTVKPRSTKGSGENVELLESGKLDLALVSGEVASDVLLGLTRPASRLKVIAAMYPQQAMFAVRGDSPVRQVRELLGKPVVWGARTSGLVTLARYVLEGMGLNMERDFLSMFVDRAADGPAAVLDGRALAIFGAGVGSPALTAVVQGPAGARLLVPTPAEVTQVAQRHKFLKPMQVPAGSYAGQAQALDSIGSWALVLARADLADGAAWRLARALHKSQPTFATRLPQARDSTLANTLAAAPAPEFVHAGVRRYAREAGIGV